MRLVQVRGNESSDGMAPRFDARDSCVPASQTRAIERGFPEVAVEIWAVVDDVPVPHVVVQRVATFSHVGLIDRQRIDACHLMKVNGHRLCTVRSSSACPRSRTNREGGHRELSPSWEAASASASWRQPFPELIRCY